MPKRRTLPGEEVIPQIEVKEVAKEESFAYQAEVLADEVKKTAIELKDGSFVEFMSELKIGDVLKRRIMEGIEALYSLIYMKALKLGEGKIDSVSTKLAFMAPVVREEMESLLAKIAGIPLSKVEANLSAKGAEDFFSWLYEKIQENKNSGK